MVHQGLGHVQAVGDHMQTLLGAQGMGDGLDRGADAQHQAGAIGHGGGHRAGDARLGIGLERLDWGPCHGDVSGGNSTYSNGRVIHFDFDCGGPGWRAYDLGVFFWSMSVNGHGDEVWDRFLHGYSALRTPSSHDLAAVRAFACARVIWLMGLWCANAHVFGYHKLHDDYFDREARRASDFCEYAVRASD